MAVNPLQIIGGWIAGAWALLTNVPGGGVVFSKNFTAVSVPPGAQAANGLPPANLTGSNATSNGFAFVDLAAGATFPSPALASPTITGPTTYPAIATHTTGDASSFALYSTPAPAAGQITAFAYQITAQIIVGGAVVQAAIFRRDGAFNVGATGEGAPADFSFSSTPFALGSTSLVPGGVFSGLSGGSWEIVVQGIGTNAFVMSAALPAGFVTNGGHVYFLATGGTDSGSAGPVGTTSSQTVGGLTYKFIATAASVSILWTLTKVDLHGPT